MKKPKIYGYQGSRPIYNKDEWAVIKADAKIKAREEKKAEAERLRAIKQEEYEKEAKFHEAGAKAEKARYVHKKYADLAPARTKKEKAGRVAKKVGGGVFRVFSTKKKSRGKKLHGGIRLF